MKTWRRSCSSRWRLPSYLRWHSFFLLLQLHCGAVLSSDTGLSAESIILLRLVFCFSSLVEPSAGMCC